MYSCFGIVFLNGFCIFPINHFPLLAVSTLVGPGGGHKITTSLNLGQLLQHSGQAQDFNHEVVGSEPARYGEHFPSFYPNYSNYPSRRGATLLIYLLW